MTLPRRPFDCSFMIEKRPVFESSRDELSARFSEDLAIFRHFSHRFESEASYSQPHYSSESGSWTFSRAAFQQATYALYVCQMIFSLVKNWLQNDLRKMREPCRSVKEWCSAIKTQLKSVDIYYIMLPSESGELSLYSWHTIVTSVNFANITLGLEPTYLSSWSAGLKLLCYH